MLNATRIIFGVIMALIAIGFTFATITFAIGYQSQVTLNWSFFAILLVILLPPFVAAWLLLFPKSKKYALVGIAIAIIYLGYLFIDQIL